MIRLIIVEITNQLAVLPALRHLGAVVECQEDAQTEHLLVSMLTNVCGLAQVR